MSLNFDVSKIANHTVVTTSPFDEKKWHTVTEALVWASMAIELGEITEANVDKFYRRLALWQKAFGPWLRFNDAEIYLTLEDVKLHIGLTTNVSNSTDKAFATKLVEAMARELHTIKNKDGISAHQYSADKAKAMKEA